VSPNRRHQGGKKTAGLGKLGLHQPQEKEGCGKKLFKQEKLCDFQDSTGGRKQGWESFKGNILPKNVAEDGLDLCS
jgi:hypothetical protein